jgi:hypothetical protein
MKSRNETGNSVRRGYLFHFDELYMGGPVWNRAQIGRCELLSFETKITVQELHTTLCDLKSEVLQPFL